MTDAGKVLSQTQELRVAPPYRRNCATFDTQGATEGATEGATTGLKAAAQRVLERNRGRNPSATEAENRRNFYPEKTVQKLRPQMHELSYPAEVTRATVEAMHPSTVEGVPLGLVLDQADREDYADLVNPAVLEAFARSLVATGTVVLPAITRADLERLHPEIARVGGRPLPPRIASCPPPVEETPARTCHECLNWSRPGRYCMNGLNHERRMDFAVTCKEFLAPIKEGAP